MTDSAPVNGQGERAGELPVRCDVPYGLFEGVTPQLCPYLSRRIRLFGGANVGDEQHQCYGM